MAEGRYLRDVLTILSPEPMEEASSLPLCNTLLDQEDSTNIASLNNNNHHNHNHDDVSNLYTQNNNNKSDKTTITKNKSPEQSKLKQRLQELKQQNIDIQKRKQETLDSYAKLLNQYEYGLNSIKKLNDLMDAPDNIMNGNQTKEAL